MMVYRTISILIFALILIPEWGQAYTGHEIIDKSMSVSYSIIPADSVDKRKLFRRLRDWVTVYSLYSNVDVNDRVDLEGLAEGASELGDIAGAFLFNGELQSEIYEFKESSFVNFYPYGLIEDQHWTIKKLNEISLARDDSKNAPYIVSNVIFVPNNELTLYKVKITLSGSEQIDINLNEVASQMNAELTSQEFSAPAGAKETVNKVLFKGMTRIKELLGNSMIPNLALRFNDQNYVHGNNIEVWKNEEPILLRAITDSETVEWEGVINPDGMTASVDVSEVGQKVVTLSSADGSISVNVIVKEFNLDVEEILKELLKEVIRERVQAAREKIDSLTTAQEGLKEAIGQQHTTYLQSEGYQLTVNAEEGDNNIIYFEEVEDSFEGTQADLIALRGDENINAMIESHRQFFLAAARVVLEINIETFLAGVIDDQETINRFAQSIRDNSPELIADLILNMTRKPENRTELKAMVINYVNEQINIVAGDAE
ncbi:hypothetical protein JMN32_09630 [Fulvivirga sp. 29W222]|uniref:Uncharacterized protein n=1 Tax=Fulvivirga marina TaxID=2494733 RepID=A0A937KDZ0_9BACT|nr:hypothetical protein [Fulvivirga marina]MBL6446570.1 hypothetical protein [Fulvivirga marina]